jgi:hypothetical protein
VGLGHHPLGVVISPAQRAIAGLCRNPTFHLGIDFEFMGQQWVGTRFLI